MKYNLKKKKKRETILLNLILINQALGAKIWMREDQVPETPIMRPKTTIEASNSTPSQSSSCLNTIKWNNAGNTNPSTTHTLLPTSDRKSAKFGTNKATKLTTKTATHLPNKQYLPSKNRLSTTSYTGFIISGNVKNKFTHSPT